MATLSKTREISFAFTATPLFLMQFWLSQIFNAYPLYAQKGSLRNVTYKMVWDFQRIQKSSSRRKALQGKISNANPQKKYILKTFHLICFQLFKIYERTDECHLGRKRQKLQASMKTRNCCWVVK